MRLNYIIFLLCFVLSISTCKSSKSKKYTIPLEVKNNWATSENKKTYNTDFDDEIIELCLNGRHEEATNRCNTVLQTNPDDASAYCNRGFVSFLTADFKNSLIDYNTAIEIKPTYAKAYFQRGTLFLACWKSTSSNEFCMKAIEDYTRTIEIDSEYSGAYLNRGTLFVDLGKITEALKDFTLAIENNPTEASAYLERAIIHADNGNKKLAKSDFEKAIEFAPDMIEAYYNFGVFHYNQKNFSESIYYFGEVLDIDPSHDGAKKMLKKAKSKNRL